jgi:hypothetical protein
MMIVSRKYKGIEFVQLEELPLTQREKIRQTINSDLLIKIMIDGTIVNDCIQFKDYIYWYNSVYKPEILATSESATVEGVEFASTQLALSNS